MPSKDIYVNTIAGSGRIDPSQYYYVLLLGDKVTRKKGSDIRKGDRILIRRDRLNVNIRQLEQYLSEDSRYAHAVSLLFEQQNGVKVPRLRSGLIKDTYNHMASNSPVWQSFVAERPLSNDRAKELMCLSPPGLEERIFAKDENSDFNPSTYGVLRDFVHRQLEQSRVEFDLRSTDTTREWLGFIRSNDPYYIMTVAPNDWRTFRALAEFLPSFRQFADSYDKRNTADRMTAQLAGSHYANYKLWRSINARIARALISGATESDNTNGGEATAIAPFVRIVERNLAMRISEEYVCIKVVGFSSKLGEGQQQKGDGFFVKTNEVGKSQVDVVKINYYSDRLILATVLRNLLDRYSHQIEGFPHIGVIDGNVVFGSMGPDYFTGSERTYEGLSHIFRTKILPQTPAAAKSFERDLETLLPKLYQIFEDLESGIIETKLNLTPGVCIDLIKTLDTVLKCEPPAFKRYVDLLHQTDDRRLREAARKLQMQEGYDVEIDMVIGINVNDVRRLVGPSPLGRYISDILVDRRTRLVGYKIPSAMGPGNYIEIVNCDTSEPSCLYAFPAGKSLGILSKFGLSSLQKYLGVPKEVLEYQTKE